MDRLNHRWTFLATMALSSGLLSMMSGCSWLARDKVAQYRAENDRLVTEFRTQRDLASRLEVQNRALIGRVSELENRLATISDAVRDPLAGFPEGSGGNYRNASQPLSAPPGSFYGDSPLNGNEPAADSWKPTSPPR